MKESSKKTSLYGAVLLILGAGLVLSILASITFGNADISIQEVYKVIFYEVFHADSFSAYQNGPVHDVVWLIRFPRVLLAAGSAWDYQCAA